MPQFLGVLKQPMYNRDELGTSFWCVTHRLHTKKKSLCDGNYAALRCIRNSGPLRVLETVTFKEGQAMVTVCLVRWIIYWVNKYYAIGYYSKLTFHPYFVSSSLHLGFHSCTGNYIRSTNLPASRSSFLCKILLASPDVLTLKRI
jgi:hypothetical protein